MKKEQLKGMCNMLLIRCQQVFDTAADMKMLDEDWFIEWQDKLNEISVAYYKKENPVG